MSEYVLIHHGILGQRWGVRRYQNRDGTLTAAGRKRLAKDVKQLNKNAENTKYWKEQYDGWDDDYKDIYYSSKQKQKQYELDFKEEYGKFFNKDLNDIIESKKYKNVIDNDVQKFIDEQMGKYGHTFFNDVNMSKIMLADNEKYSKMPNEEKYKYVPSKKETYNEQNVEKYIKDGMKSKDGYPYSKRKFDGRDVSIALDKNDIRGSAEATEKFFSKYDHNKAIDGIIKTEYKMLADNGWIDDETGKPMGKTEFAKKLKLEEVSLLDDGKTYTAYLGGGDDYWFLGGHAICIEGDTKTMKARYKSLEG